MTDETKKSEWLSRLASLVDIVFSKQVSIVILSAVVAFWLIYRILLKTYIGVVFTESTFFTWGFFTHRILTLCLFCEVAFIWREGYSRRDAIALAVFFIMATGLYINGFFDALYDAIIILAVRHLPFRQLLGFATAVIATMLIVIILCSIAGVIPDSVIVQGARERHCLGFLYCLFPAQYLFAITCSFLLLRDKKTTWAEIAILIVLNVVIMLLTDSRLSFGLSIVVIAAVAARKLLPSDDIWKFIARAASWCFVFVVCVSVLAVCLYAIQEVTGGTWMNAFNKLASNRISLAYKGVVEFGSCIFGQEVAWLGNSLDYYGNRTSGTYNYVDNLFFHSLIQYGWVYTIALFSLYTAVSRKMLKSGSYFSVIVFAVLALHFLVDDLCLELHYNILLFALSTVLVASVPNKTQGKQEEST